MVEHDAALGYLLCLLAYNTTVSYVTLQRFNINIISSDYEYRELKIDEPSHEECLERLYARPVCKPKNKIIYVKTHKTASTTLASILERYGYTRNLTIAVPNGNHVFSNTELFNKKMVSNFADMKNYDMLTNHARYNRRKLDSLIPNATYITILRHPVQQFESAFGYFQWGRFIPAKDPISEFLRNPEKFTNKIPTNTRNGQLFDLGLSATKTLDAEIVNETLQTLHKEIDVVLITEYFDESLLILRDLLCWSVNDILYISNGIRSDNRRSNLTSTDKDKILEWNKSDLKLYLYFRKVLFNEIRHYGPCFKYHLQEFRKLQNETLEKCIEMGQFKYIEGKEFRHVLKENATEFCKDLWKGDVTFTKLNRMQL
ncbi:galactosylceramide sulfotransferase-like [Saccoglossus kowalevskii]